MTALDVDTFDLNRRPSRVADLATRWPIYACLWLTFLFLLATNNLDAVNRWQETSREDAFKLARTLESGRAVRQLAFILMALWGAAMFIFPAKRFRFDPIFLFPIGVFVAWAIASVLWSTDRSFTVKRLLATGFLVMAVLGFIRRYRLRDLALLALIGCTIQMFASIAADLLWAPGFPGSPGYRFSGLQHPNHSGINAVFLCFACLFFYDRTRLRRFLVLFGIALVVLFLTKSRSALFAGVAGMGMFALLRWPIQKVVFAGIVGSMGVGLMIALAAAGWLSPDVAEMISMGRDDAQKTTLTGRPMIWNAALELFGTDPGRWMMGVGYETFWTPIRAEYVTNRLGFHISEGHNAFFDTTLELGLVGSMLYAAILLGSHLKWSALAIRRNSGAFAFAAAVLTFVLVHSLTESTTIDPNFCTFFNYACLLFIAIRAPAWLSRSEREEAELQEAA